MTNDPICTNCGHSLFSHPEMEWGETDGYCSGDEDCKCTRFEKKEQL